MTTGIEGISDLRALAPRRRTVSRRNLGLRVLIAQILSIVLLLVLWEVAARVRASLLLPPPTRVVTAWMELALSGELFRALAVSLQSLVIGYALAVAVGVPLGLAVGRFRVIERTANFYLNGLLALPMISLIPIFVMVFGIGLTARVAVVFVFAVIVICINSYAGVRAVDSSMVEMARSFEASERQLFTKVLLPGALPMVLAGCRLGADRSFGGMLTGELLFLAVGLGGQILGFSARYEMHKLFAVLVTVAVVATTGLWLIEVMNRRLTRWQQGIVRV